MHIIARITHFCCVIEDEETCDKVGLSDGILVLVGCEEVDGVEVGWPDGAEVGGSDVVGELLGLGDGYRLGLCVGSVEILGLPEGV